MIHFIGDIHGDFLGLTNKIRALNITNATLIQVGDFGVGFQSFEQDMLSIKKLNNFLLKTRNHLHVIRGNHDNPKFFDGSIRRSNLHLLKDYSIVQAEGKHIFLAGGAVSIDRRQRMVDRNYWTDESFEFDLQKLESISSEIDNIDIVVTHSCPAEFWPYTVDSIKRYLMRDKSLLTDIENERTALSKLLHVLVTTNKKNLRWYYGHFHESKSGSFNQIRYRALRTNEIIHI